MSFSERGYCRIDVRVAEPVVGIGGRSSEQAYDLIRYFGRLSPDGEKVTSQEGDSVPGSLLNRLDEVRLTQIGEDKLIAQAYLGGRPTAYPVLLSAPWVLEFGDSVPLDSLKRHAIDPLSSRVPILDDSRSRGF